VVYREQIKCAGKARLEDPGPWYDMRHDGTRWLLDMVKKTGERQEIDIRPPKKDT